MTQKSKPLTEGMTRKGGHNQWPSQITGRPAGPAPMIQKTPPTCEECGHFFDPSDKRSCMPSERFPDMRPCCPACALMNYSGAEAWAVANDCNGVFTDTVAQRRADAERTAAQPPFSGDDCKAVPVRIFIDEGEREWLRHGLEDDAERMRQKSER